MEERVGKVVPCTVGSSGTSADGCITGEIEGEIAVHLVPSCGSEPSAVFAFAAESFLSPNNRAAAVPAPAPTMRRKTATPKQMRLLFENDFEDFLDGCSGGALGAMASSALPLGASTSARTMLLCNSARSSDRSISRT